MKFHPIKYRQPIFGDSRCALYSLANILDDKGILMFNNVNEMTDINEENMYLMKYAQAVPSTPFCKLLPYFVVPSCERIDVEQIRHIQPVDKTRFGVSLIDYLPEGSESAHTVAGFWLDGDELLVIDPQKNDPIETTKTAFFCAVRVVGIRFVQSNDSEVPEFSTTDFPHIFKQDAAPTENTTQKEILCQH